MNDFDMDGAWMSYQGPSQLQINVIKVGLLLKVVNQTYIKA